MKADELLKFLTWLDKKHDIVLCGEEWVWDGDDENLERTSFDITESMLAGWLKEMEANT